jgi:hypothetical protein
VQGWLDGQTIINKISSKQRVTIDEEVFTGGAISSMFLRRSSSRLIAPISPGPYSDLTRYLIERDICKSEKRYSKG